MPSQQQEEVLSAKRAPKDDINIRILQNSTSGIPITLGLRTSMSVPYVSVVFWAQKKGPTFSCQRRPGSARLETKSQPASTPHLHFKTPLIPSIRDHIRPLTEVHWRVYLVSDAEALNHVLHRARQATGSTSKIGSLYRAERMIRQVGPQDIEQAWFLSYLLSLLFRILILRTCSE